MCNVAGSSLLLIVLEEVDFVEEEGETEESSSSDADGDVDGEEEEASLASPDKHFVCKSHTFSSSFLAVL